jgi:peptide/nickel transport system substrate-binding protein
VMFDMSSTAAADIAGDDGFGLLEQLNAKWIPLGIDSTVAPFDNPDLILAIKSAIDRQAVIDTALGGFGTIGYDTPIPAEDANFGGLPEPEFNLDTAREHLADAGYPDGVTLPTLTVLDIPQAISVALVLQQQLAEVGITFEIERESSATFWDNSWLIKPFFSNDYLRRTPDEILKLVSVSDGAWNISKRVDPEVDAAVAAAAATTDPAEQKEQYTIAQELLAARDTVIVPAHVSRLSGVVAGLDGIETNPVYFLDLRGAGFTE